MERKTVATITYHRSDNFGSVLQAYALGEKLQQMGYGQFVIDYRKKEVAQNYKILKPWTNKFNVVTDFYHLLHYGALKCRQTRFEQFRQKYLRLSKPYFRKTELMDEPPKAAVYITGSDQVWNTGILDYDDSYLLDFVKEGKKIAYAVSGVRHDGGLLQKEMHLKAFSALSVRENRAKDYLEQVVPTAICLDPVLLLEKQDWEKLCRPQNRSKPYMLCYFSGNVTEEFEHVTRDLAKKLGLERVILMPQWRNFFRPGTNCYDAGPEEFVSLLQQAQLVCTNSFHGTAFSLVLNKPFLVGQAEPFADDRIATLLGVTGLQNREVDPGNPQLPENMLDLDFSGAGQVLQQLRLRSEQWLHQAIEGETV